MVLAYFTGGIETQRDCMTCSMSDRKSMVKAKNENFKEKRRRKGRAKIINLFELACFKQFKYV